MAMIGYKEEPEKRKFPRTKKQFIIRYRAFKGAEYEGGWSPATTQDISEEGCYFTATVPFEKEAHIEILMKIPASRDDLRFVAEVRHCTQLSARAMEVYGIGVQFQRVGSSSLSMAVLKTYLDKVIPAKNSA